MAFGPAPQVFTREEYDFLAEYVFRPGYAGYKPTVKEIPNGDGKVDEEKRFAHIATKYFAPAPVGEKSVDEIVLLPYLKRAHDVALRVAEHIRLPKAFWPVLEYGALRVLDYPPGAVSNKHEDFDLFTVMCFREQPDRFKADRPDITAEGLWTIKQLDEAQRVNPQCHFGQIAAALGLADATPHEVIASDTIQRSIVYFAIPDHNVYLPQGRTTDEGPNLPVMVREWLNDRMARSRTEFKAYE